MSDPGEVKHEVIDVDDPDVFCTGVRHRIRIDCPPSPRNKKRTTTISLLDTDNEPVASPSRPQDTSPWTELQRVTQSELISRSAYYDAHPSNKRTSDALKIASRVVRNHDVREVIEISSDSEPERSPSKRQRIHQHVSPYHVSASISADSTPTVDVKFSPAERDSPVLSDRDGSDSDDDDHIHLLTSLDISNESNWAPLPESNKAEDLTPIHDLDGSLTKPHFMPSFHVPRKKPPIDCRRLPSDWVSTGPWGTISKHYGITRFPKPFFHARRQDRLFPRRSPSLHYENGYTKLELTAKYPHLMSGSVNKIIQAQGSVVMCAVVAAGIEESDDEQDVAPPPENRSGSLVVYRNGQVHVEPAHCHSRRTSLGSVMKYYSVNDIAFHPLNPHRFLSSGHDFAVQVWGILDPEDNQGRMGLCAIRDITIDSRPQDFVYSPDGLLLAITCNDGTIRMYVEDLCADMIDVDLPFKKFHVAPRGSDHATGSTLWGKGPSKHLLFSSSEPKEREDYNGFHRAFDIGKGTQAIHFNATESGDFSTLSPDGTTLVLFTAGRDGVHPVRLYDVRRKSKDAYETEELEKFKMRSPTGLSQERGDFLGEVNQAIFSPDGYLLAVARNDNALHIYDIRAFSRGPLCRFEHHNSDATGGGGFGVVTASWIQGRDRIGIVSGGDDGCVRLWEPALGSASEVQGAILGRSDFDVGHFSIGNPQRGELPLIIGDSGGGVHTYDFTNTDGVRL